MSIAHTQILSALDRVHQELAIAGDDSAAFSVSRTRDLAALHPRDTPVLLSRLARDLRDLFDVVLAANVVDQLMIHSSIIEVDNCVRDLEPFMEGAADGQT